METVKKQGYKQTELGLIPEDWEVKSYDQIFRFLSTATYSRADLTENDDVGYIHYGDIHTRFNYHLNIDKVSLPSIPDSKSKNYSKIEEGDVVMADASEDYSGVGKSIEVRRLGGQKVISGLHTFLLRDNNKIFVEGYRGYVHSIGDVKKQFDELATGMKVYGVSKNNLKKVLIPIPPKKEQTAIATALSDMDSYISSLEALIAKKRLIKQGAMQELLTPKEGWEGKTFEELFQISGGFSASREQLGNDGICYLHYGDIHGAKKTFIDVSSEFQSIPKLNVSLYKISRTSFLGHGDIVFVDASKDDDGVSRHIVVVNPDEIPFISGLHTIVAKKKKDYLDIDFSKYCFQSKYIKDQFKFYAVGTKVSGVSKSSIKKIELKLPSLKVQKSIGEILGSMDSEIHSIEQELEKAKQIKQGMMQDLLTGRVRLV